VEHFRTTTRGDSIWKKSSGGSGPRMGFPERQRRGRKGKENKPKHGSGKTIGRANQKVPRVGVKRLSLGGSWLERPIKEKNYENPGGGKFMEDSRFRFWGGSFQLCQEGEHKVGVQKGQLNASPFH